MSVYSHSNELVEINAAAASSPHRRELLAGLLAVALAALAGWPPSGTLAAALPLERKRFLELSAKLCAMPLENGSLADIIQNALIDQHAAGEFRQLAKLLDAAAPEDVGHLAARSGVRQLAKSIISIWYSGQFGTGEEARVLAYEEALAWPATGYAKAPGSCGVFGDWTAKPDDALSGGHRP